LVDLLAAGVNQVRRAKASSNEVVDHVHQLREELNWFYSKVNAEEVQAGVFDETKVTEIRELIHTRETQLAKILRQLPAQDEEYASLHSVVSVPLERIQESLTDSQILIEYYIIQNRVMAFLVTRDAVKLISPLAEAAKVKNELDLLKYQLSKFNFGSEYVSNHLDFLQKSIDTHLGDLYQSLVQPQTAELEGRELIFVPHDFLHYVPFHALKADDHYLIDRFTISYSPSASVFKLCSSKPSSTKKRSLVMGIPEPRIPHVLQEVRDIASLLNDSTLLVGPEATEAQLKSLGSEASILHIASHAVFRADNPMFSSIQLGTSWLNLFDVYNIELDSDLVTLSGCGTGMNRVVDGDELVGLVRGFFYAGTRSLLVSLWNVNDQTTAEFMRAFYSNLSQNRHVAQSLRRAMLQVKKANRHPYYWAPFFLMGKTTQ
jgi:CHAT domain-containing protein